MTSLEDKERSIYLHMELLKHACECQQYPSGCSSKTCSKMKEFLVHFYDCQNVNCPLCQRIRNLLQIHRNRCNNEQCVVPFCILKRERIQTSMSILLQGRYQH